MAAAAKNDSEWLIHVKDSLEKDEVGADETNSDVCIFGIAHPLLRLKPESYIPQVISIGPYHYRKLEQYEETDTDKLKMARALERECSPFKFAMLVERIKSLEGRIRACYHKHVPYDTETLSWMLALDTSFLLQFLKSIYRPYGESQSRLMRKHTVLHSKRKTPIWYAIKNDILMLENQVPMFLLIEALCVTADCIHSDTQVGSKSQREVYQHNGRFGQTRSQSHLEISQDTNFQEKLHLAGILQAACLHLNPFVRETKYLPGLFEEGKKAKSHVLDYLYGYVTAASREPVKRNSEPRNQASGIVFSGFERYLFNKMLIHHAGGIDRLKRMISATTAGNLPSATEMSEAGIKFAPYDSGDLQEISFKRTTCTLLLPKIKIDDSTEVVLRNLVALELNLEIKQKPLTRYTYLMDRLIDTEKDVAVLKRCGILISKMGSDAEVAQMWNSMSKSTWENTFEPVDKAIDEANKYYSSKWRVLLAQFQKKDCSKPWLVISIFSAAVLLSLTAIQVFCLFYTCNK